VAPGWLALLVLAVSLAFFGGVLFRGHQFGYRDSAHYYYPLYQRVQQEWAAGRLPLWEPEENGGVPLLGNPTAAVLYPGKLIYTFAPTYAWGARLYILAHVGLAIASSFLLGRTLGLSRTASTLAALSYGFGVPVLFQYCNVIFLVGAAWLPIGLLGADRWLRRGERMGIAWLALAIAMAVLGGDPQAAYLTGVCSAGYALVLERARRRPAAEVAARHRRHFAWFAAGAAMLVLWVAATICAELVFARTPAQVGKPPKLLPWVPWAEIAIRLGWVAAAVAVVWRWRKQPSPRVLPRLAAGLGLAAGLSALLSAAQLLPAAEFTALSSRAAAESGHDIYPFSLEPARLVELACPSFYGSSYRGNSFWLSLVPPRHAAEVWIPSLYLGVLTVVLACHGARGGTAERTPWRMWMVAIALLGLTASLGRFGSPLWAARCVPAWTPWLGPHDPLETPPVRLDGHLRDGDGSLYWALAAGLPGFGGFRYPSKLLVLTSLALAILAGRGCDRLRSSDGPRVPRSWLALAILLLLGLAAVVLARSAIVEAFSGSRLTQGWSVFGKFQPEAGWWAITLSLLQPALVLCGAGALLAGLRRRPAWLATGLLAFHALDLTTANARFVLTVPQALFDDRPEVLRRIEEAERTDPMPGGLYRVHRMGAWQLQAWGETASPRIHEDYVRWERRTIQPKYAIPYGMSYTLTEGASELYDYMFFFPPFEGVYSDPAVARAIFGDNPPERVIAYPRRGFDLWNTRYFVLPYQRSNDTRRGVASFLPDTTELAPGGRRDDESATARLERLKAWGRDEDWQLMRNEAAYPRAWVVHNATMLPPIRGLGRKDREAPMFEILYQNDPFWSVPNRPVYDPRTRAWLEVDDRKLVDPYLSRTEVRPGEAPRIVRYEPERVEIEVSLETPGFVILADVDYPGWQLTIDGRPAPILRANRLMRGAGVHAGEHRLVYTYKPASVRWGLAGSLLGILGWLALVAASRFRGRDRVLAAAIGAPLNLSEEADTVSRLD
jgi:hypothetical protein